MDTIIIDRENTQYVESIIDENNDTQIVPVFRKKLIRTNDYINRLVSQLGSGSVACVLPRNCRMNIPFNNAKVIVIEESPRPRYLRFDMSFVDELRLVEKTGQSQLGLESLLDGQEHPYSLKIQLPYVIFIMYIQEKIDGFDIPYCRVFFRNHPLGCSGDYLAYANLFNLSSTNEVCFGSNKKSYPKNRYTCSSAVEAHIALYWSTPFTPEYRCRHDMYIDTPPMNSFLAWSMASRKPTFGFSIPLITHKETLNTEIESFIASRTAMSFDRLFLTSMEEQTSEIGGIVTYQNLKLINNIVNIGDKLIVDGQDYYIDAIFGNSNRPKTVDLINTANEKITIELTTSLLTQWEADVTAQKTNYLSSFNVGEKRVSAGTIIRIKSIHMYEIVDKIRIARDNSIEFIIGSKFFLALDGSYDVIDSIKAGDTELVPGIDYIIFNNQYRTYFRGRMVRIKNNSYHLLLHVFFSDVRGNVNGAEYGISVDSIYNGDFSIFAVNDPRIVFTRTFRFLDQIITGTEFCIVKGFGVFSINDSADTWNSFQRVDALNNIIFEGGTKLHILSFDTNIDFVVGDEVIVADWNDENNLSKIWTITSFTSDSDYLNINLQSGDEIKQCPYIKLSNGRIKAGLIRKVTRSLNGIEAGSLIQAKKPGILGFPKKAINKIIAFIIDSKQPLVLCGNGMTIELEHLTTNFNIVTTTRTPESIHSNKIAWQTGDICIKGDNLFVYNSDNTYLGKLYMLIDPIFVKTGSFHSKAIVSIKNNADFQRYGILNPRLSKILSHVVYEQLPDLMNGTTHTFSDGYYPSTIPNVSEE